MKMSLGANLTISLVYFLEWRIILTFKSEACLHFLISSLTAVIQAVDNQLETLRNTGGHFNWVKITTLSWLFLTGNIHMFSNVARDAHYYPRRHRNERVWTQEQEEEENRPQVARRGDFLGLNIDILPEQRVHLHIWSQDRLSHA